MDWYMDTISDSTDDATYTEEHQQTEITYRHDRTRYAIRTTYPEDRRNKRHHTGTAIDSTENSKDTTLQQHNIQLWTNEEVVYKTNEVTTEM
jgi:hypothetical protein